MKIAVVYHSETENTQKVADIVVEGAEKVEGVEVKSMSIDHVDEAFINEAKVVFFGTPTYAGTCSWQMKKWMDTSKIKLAGKVGCVFATENFLGGGAENAELSLISMLLVKGMFAYSVGVGEGLPYTHFGAVCTKDGTEEEQERVRLFGERVARNVQKSFKE